MEERVLYGYMDGDYLQCIEIAPIPQKIRNEKTGEITTRAMLCALCHTMPGTGFHSDT